MAGKERKVLKSGEVVSFSIEYGAAKTSDEGASFKSKKGPILGKGSGIHTAKQAADVVESLRVLGSHW